MAQTQLDRDVRTSGSGGHRARREGAASSQPGARRALWIHFREKDVNPRAMRCGLVKTNTKRGHTNEGGKTSRWNINSPSLGNGVKNGFPMPLLRSAASLSFQEQPLSCLRRHVIAVRARPCWRVPRAPLTRTAAWRPLWERTRFPRPRCTEGRSEGPAGFAVGLRGPGSRTSSGSAVRRGIESASAKAIATHAPEACPLVHTWCNKPAFCFVFFGGRYDPCGIQISRCRRPWVP